MTARRVLLVLLLACLACLGWWSRHSLHWVPVTLETGFQGEALENPTLLLQKWLASQGRSVTRQGGIPRAGTLPEGGCMILLHLAHPLSTSETEILLAWVRRGGHLITDGTAEPFQDQRGLDTLHRALGVTLQKVEDQHGKGAFEDSFQDTPLPYRVWRTTEWVLDPDAPEAWPLNVELEDGSVLLSRPEGAGRITLTPDLGFVCHTELARLDHAAYLQRLLDLQPGRGPVLVWSLPVDLSLASWLWQHAKAPGLALLILLAAWIWRGWPRFGPLLPAPQTRRRSLLEHIAASGRLIWKHGGTPHLLRRTREALERRAERLNAEYGSLDLPARAQWLAQEHGPRPEEIAAALVDRPDRTPENAAHTLLLLEQLRQKLRTP